MDYFHLIKIYDYKKNNEVLLFFYFWLVIHNLYKLFVLLSNLDVLNLAFQFSTHDQLHELFAIYICYDAYVQIQDFHNNIYAKFFPSYIFLDMLWFFRDVLNDIDEYIQIKDIHAAAKGYKGIIETTLR